MCALLVALLTGCSGGSWLPAVSLSGQASRRLDATSRRARTERWDTRLGLGLRWDGPDPGGEPTRPRAAVERPADPALGERPACRSELLCAWERRQRARWTHELIGGDPW